MGLVKTGRRLAEDGSPQPGDAETAAREDGDETANAQTGAEVRAVPTAPFKTSPHEDPSPKPVGSQFANCGGA